MFRPIVVCAGAVMLALPAPALTAQQLNRYGYPEKHAPRATAGEITVGDLMTRLYIFADDSMMGRQSGRIGNEKGTDYIAGELRRLGIEPGGDDGGYFQTLPYIQRKFTDRSMLMVGDASLRFNVDFVPVPGTTAPTMSTAQAIYGGVSGDTSTYITAEQAAGKFVILAAGAGAATGGRGAFGAGAGMARFAGAAGVATVNLDALSAPARAMINEPAATFSAADARRTVPAGDIVISRGGRVAIVRGGVVVGGAMPAGMNAESVKAYADSVARADSVTAAARGNRGAPGGGARGAAPVPVQQFRLTRAAAERVLGKSLDAARAGDLGGSVMAHLDFVERKTNWGRNVVGIIRGSDPTLRGQFVAIGAHNDHVGYRNGAIDHDSARAMASERLRLQMASGDLRALTPDQASSVKVNLDSIRRIRPVRMDSINNGADDDGSGSMAVLEIAEAVQAMRVKPKRSIVFVWHTAEESGMHGSRHFASNPSVPIDSIVTAINVDMIGRGRAEDVIGGGDDYTGILGARRLSAGLGNIVDAVNARRSRPIRLDARFDDPTIGTSVNGVVSWPGYQNLYGRSDHTRYAEKCVPIVFFFTGLHGDYHQVTDEPQYIDYPHYATLTGFIRDLVVAIGNEPVRPALDGMCVRR